MKIFNCNKYNISKKYLISASAYRRFTKSKYHLFGLDELINQYRHETFGGPKPDIKINGFTYGKSVMDVTLTAYKEDLIQGLFCKSELINGNCALARRTVMLYSSNTLFGYNNEINLGIAKN